MSWEEDYLMKKVGELETRLSVVEGRVDVQEPILASEEEPESGTDYSSWTNKQLQDELTKRELPTYGNKGDLVTRLVEADAGETEEAKTEETQE